MAWREGRQTYDSPLCAWAELQLLRATQNTRTAEQLAKDLAHRYAESIVAQFTTPMPYEYWHVPEAALWVDVFRRSVQNPAQAART